MQFIRELGNEAIEALRKEPLFIQCLQDDCKKGEVFPAVRQNRIDFYHKGGKLFSWDKNKGFSTHHKYASVLVPINKDSNKDYIRESELYNARLIKDFCEEYSRIKENCALYSGDEAIGVAELYHRFSCASRKEHDVVCLDIEIAFSNVNGDVQGHDRIDFVTLEYATGKLRFFEAKHYSNRTSLRSDNKGHSTLFTQLDRYDGQLKRLSKEILNAYTMHISILNKVFDLSIPQPMSVDATTRAIIFGFDAEQKKYLDKNIVKDENGLKNRTYTVGDIKKADLQAMFRGGRQNWE